MAGGCTSTSSRGGRFEACGSAGSGERSSKKPFFTLKPSDVRELLRRALGAAVHLPLREVDEYLKAIESATDEELLRVARRWYHEA